MANKTTIKRYVLIILSLMLALVQLSGCSIARYDSGDISDNPELVRLDNFNNIEDIKKIFTGVTTEHIPNTNKVAINWSGIRQDINDIELGADKTFSVKYHRSLLFPAPNVSIPVEFPTGRKYIAYIDTGYSGAVTLTSDIVLDNKLAIFPNGPAIQTNGSGLCLIPEFRIGSARIIDTLDIYDQQQWQFRILNIPIYKHTAIILGLEFFKFFDYVMFDNVNQEVVFSKEGAFEPDNPELWSSYPFEIKPDSSTNDRIMVQMPINGQVYELFFDSCGYKPGLDLNKSHWQVIEPNSNVKRIRRSYIHNYQSGRSQCQRATVSELSIGDKVLRNAEIVISGDPDGLSVLSLGYFQDTAVVLDFVNNLMCIKR